MKFRSLTTYAFIAALLPLNGFAMDSLDSYLKDGINHGDLHCQVTTDIENKELEEGSNTGEVYCSKKASAVPEIDASGTALILTLMGSVFLASRERKKSRKS